MKQKPFLAITPGDAAGIGPEVTVKALLSPKIYQKCQPFVIGSAEVIDSALKMINASSTIRSIHSLEEVASGPQKINVLDLENLNRSAISYGEVSAMAGKASVEWILKAGHLAISGQIQAITTAPINKAACRMAGYNDIGHMEIFQTQTGAKDVATMLMAEKLRVVHLTTHKTLREACDSVTKTNILSKIRLTYESFKSWGFPSPKIGVAALNPHASDDGLIGNEEGKEIGPAIEEARSIGIDATGPIPSDTIFNQAIDGIYDVVLAMYHDQGHIPVKIHNWAKSVSLNLGLPFIRTSVDHGTAFDIAGEGVADPSSMLEAIEVAAELASENRLP